MKVYTAISTVAKAMSHDGIGKGRKNTQQGYNFRGIDDVLNALSSALTDAGLVILPRVTQRECVERTSAKGGALFYVTVHIDFDLVAVEDGSKHTVTTYGEAMDSADKATNKAMSAAYKYLALLTFCIPTEATPENDADFTTHEVQAKSVAPKVSSQISAPREIFDSLPHDWQQYLKGIAPDVANICEQQGPEAAWDLIRTEKVEGEYLAGLYSLLDSKVRSKLDSLTAKGKRAA